AIPGEGIRRAGGDVAEGSSFAAGRPVRPLDLLIARVAGLDRLAVRRPRLQLIEIPGTSVTAQLIVESAGVIGCQIIRVEAEGRDPASIARAFDGEPCDLLVTIGVTGVGRTD